MIEMIPWLRARNRSRNRAARVTAELVHPSKFYGGGDVEQAMFQSREHYVPIQLIQKHPEPHGNGPAKKIVVRSKGSTRIVIRPPGTNKVITVWETTNDDTETICIPVDDDQGSPSS